MNPRIISLISYAPGNGKTTTALNLALALHKLGEKTIVIDTDFSKLNMIEHLDITHLPVTMEDVLLGKTHIMDSIYSHPSGLRMIPSMTVAGYDRLQYHLKDLLADYRFIILDTGKEPFMDLPSGSLNEALIVHSPHNSSKHVIDALEDLRKKRISVLGAVMNKSKSSTGSIFGMPIIANIPEHKHIHKSYILKHPVVHTHPFSFVSKKYLHLAEMLR